MTNEQLRKTIKYLTHMYYKKFRTKLKHSEIYKSSNVDRSDFSKFMNNTKPLSQNAINKIFDALKDTHKFKQILKHMPYIEYEEIEAMYQEYLEQI